jgi:hypothetical protein
MDRTDVAAQQARLAEYRKQQQNTKQPDRPTSFAKHSDPEGQLRAKEAPLAPTFHKAHDHAVTNDKNPGLPQQRQQDAARATPSGMNGPTPPQSTGREVNRKDHLARLQETHRQAKARQEQADHGKMKDGKDHG